MKRLHAILMTLLLPVMIYHGYARWMLLSILLLVHKHEDLPLWRQYA